MRRKVNMESHEVEMRTHYVVLLPSRVVGPISHLVGPFLDFFASTKSYWPKTDYIYDPLGYLMRVGRETWSTQYGYEDFKDRRGMLLTTLDCPFASINTISFVTMMKRE
jgi:hypothetical protein